jgi:hypothetical protein
MDHACLARVGAKQTLVTGVYEYEGWDRRSSDSETDCRRTCVAEQSCGGRYMQQYQQQAEFDAYSRDEREVGASAHRPGGTDETRHANVLAACPSTMAVKAAPDAARSAVLE